VAAGRVQCGQTRAKGPCSKGTSLHNSLCARRDNPLGTGLAKIGPVWYLVSYFAKGSLLQFVSYLVVRDVKAQNVMRDSSRLLITSLGSDLCAVRKYSTPFYVSATQSWRVAGGRYAATGWFTRDLTSAERYHSPYGNAHSQLVFGLLCGRFLRGERKQLLAVSSTTGRHALLSFIVPFPCSRTSRSHDSVVRGTPCVLPPISGVRRPLRWIMKLYGVKVRLRGVIPSLMNMCPVVQRLWQPYGRYASLCLVT
jgi:hypothetical protein